MFQEIKLLLIPPLTQNGSETNNLTVTATTLQVDGIIGGTQTLGAISITGILDLNAAISNATSLSVSSTSNLGAMLPHHLHKLIQMM